MTQKGYRFQAQVSLARHLIPHRDVSEAVRGFLYSCQLSPRTVFFNNTVATHHLSKSHTLSEVNWILKTNIKFHRYNRSLKIFLSSELAANCVSLNGSGRMKLPWVCIIILQTIDRKCMTGWEKICDFSLVDMRQGRERFKVQKNSNVIKITPWMFRMLQ